MPHTRPEISRKGLNFNLRREAGWDSHFLIENLTTHILLPNPNMFIGGRRHKASGAATRLAEIADCSWMISTKSWRIPQTRSPATLAKLSSPGLLPRSVRTEQCTFGANSAFARPTDGRCPGRMAYRLWRSTQRGSRPRNSPRRFACEVFIGTGA